MNCSQCGNEAPVGANACPNCGASLAAAAPPGASAAPPGAGASMPVGASPVTSGSPMSGFAFEINRLSREERIAGVASLVLLISLFLPWVTGSATETVNGVTTTSVSYGSISGFSLHGYFWIVFILSLAVVAFTVAKAGFATMPIRLPLPDDQLLLGATAISFIIVLLGFLFTGYGFSGSTVNSGLYHYHAGISRSFGAYLSLVAAIVATFPYAWPVIQQQRKKS